jgi:ADP-heptose:LPS heptosyltransferase
MPPVEVIQRLGDEHPAEFFRFLIEPLADSFEAADAAAYRDLMRAWVAPLDYAAPSVPERVETVYVLSRVTLGADIKITSCILDAMKKRFPNAEIILVSNRKSAELFATDARIFHLNADYPRSASVSERIAFAGRLNHLLSAHNSIVVDPDSRMTQLGLCGFFARGLYFHFQSRTANRRENLSELTQLWLEEVFGLRGSAYVAPELVPVDDARPRAAVSFGVGENNSKSIAGDFESEVIRKLGDKVETIWVDRGAGGEEAQRVTAAIARSGCTARVRFWEGSFAGFASIISQSNLYVGYDSAGQHAAAALGVPLIVFFKGACSDRFRRRWMPSGPGKIDIIDADLLTPEQCLAQFAALLE